jgi:peptide deformylase
VSESVDETDIRGSERVEPEGPGDDRAEALAEETLRRRAAALEHIRKFGDPVLKSRASEITSFGPELEREAERMIAIMRDAIGVGLAATQLGVMHRLLVFQAGPDATPTAVANPTIEWFSDDQEIAEEGCLSLPRVAVDVERPLFARIGGVDVKGERLEIEASGLEARVLQHEIDHLDGVLMLDRAPRDQRKAALRALREGGEYSPSAEEPAEEETPAPAAS